MRLPFASALILIASGAAVSRLPLLHAAAAAAPPAAAVHDLQVRDLIGMPGKELRMLTVEYLPGGASLPHRHDAQVFLYVLEGSVRMQVQGGPLVTLGQGETFYESPDDIHSVSANASATQPARVLVFAVKDKDAPISKPAVPEHRS